MTLTRRVLAVVATLGLTAVGAHPAAAAFPDPLSPCHFVTVLNPLAERTTYSGEMFGKALLPAGESLRAGHLKCTVGVGGPGTHAGTIGPTTTGPLGLNLPLVLVSGPSLLDFYASPLDTVYICSEAVFTDGSLYWDSTFQEWRESDAVACAQALNLGPVIAI